MPSFVEHWGDNLQFYPNFALFSKLGWMNLDHDLFPVSKVSKDQKKVFTENLRVFSPNLSEDKKTTKNSDTDQSQIIGGDADVDHSQIIGGSAVKLLGVYIPHPLPPLPGFSTPGNYHWNESNSQNFK